jgi:hypothetical protein
MNKKQLKERILTKLIKEVLSENAPAKPEEKEEEETVVAPNKPGEKERERHRRDLRPDKDKDPTPKHIPAKAVGLKEADILNKIVARFKSKK